MLRFFVYSVANVQISSCRVLTKRLMVICGNVLEPHNRERVRENPVYSSEHRQYVHGMMFMRTNVIPEI